MKKIYSLFLALLAFVTMSAQGPSGGPLLTQDSANPWVIKVKFNDWAFFDPGFEKPVYLYAWVNTGHNTFGENLWDQWGEWATTTQLVWDNDQGAMMGTLDFSSHIFKGSNTKISVGNTVNQFGFLLTNGEGGQTGDRLATDHGFTPFTLAALSVSDVNGKTKSQVASGKLFTSAKGNLDLTVYDFGGKVIKTLKVNANGNPIELNLSQKGMYLMKISGNNISEVVKFAY